MPGAGFNVTLENDATTTLGQIRLHSYLHLAGIVILYYDYLVTFSDEFNYMWFQGKRIPWFFFINRYFSILVDLSLGAAQLITYNSIEKCITIHAISQTCLVIAQTIVSVVLLMRTYVLYNRSWKILAFILVISSGLLAVCIWALVTRKTGLRSSDTNSQIGCVIVETTSSELHIAGAWDALMAFDIMIFITIVVKTYTQRDVFRREGGRLKNLLQLVFRDGVIYFIVMAVANTANMVTFYTLPPVLKSCLARVTSSISVTLVSRLILNLRIRAVERDTESFGGVGTSVSFQAPSRIPSDTFTNFRDSGGTGNGRAHLTSVIVLPDSHSGRESRNRERTSLLL
ncbi:hypothetical protein ABKN59_008683 [Abortiporus biennis]